MAQHQTRFAGSGAAAAALPNHASLNLLRRSTAVSSRKPTSRATIGQASQEWQERQLHAEAALAGICHGPSSHALAGLGIKEFCPKSLRLRVRDANATTTLDPIPPRVSGLKRFISKTLELLLQGGTDLAFLIQFVAQALDLRPALLKISRDALVRRFRFA